MLPIIQPISAKKLLGNHLTMSLVQNRTFELWSSFMPRRKEITNNLTTDLFSLQQFDPDFDFENFNPAALFEKWAAIEVADFETVPGGMDALIIPAGLYAVFIHKGDASLAPQTFGYIFGTWLPASGYAIDSRPHFEILGEKYKRDSMDSEEEVWIPIKKRRI